MSLTGLQRILIFAWQSFWRNFWLSVVTISIIVLTFISINFLIVVNIVTDAAIDIIKERVDISIYFKPEVTETQVLEVESYLSSLSQVKQTNYISQTNALEKFRQLHRQDKAIIESLEELKDNPIGATLQIKAKTIDDYPQIDEVISSSRYSDLILEKNFDESKEFIEQIKSISDNIKKVGLITILIFITIAALIVFNTIRVAIYTHRQEIAIMKLVGATNWFIRSPFLLEAVLYGIVSCLITIAIIYPALGLLQPYVNNFFGTDQFSITAFFKSNFWEIFGLELLAIILLNIVSSIIAIRRYLKV